MKNRFLSISEKIGHHTGLYKEDGSVILIVLMVLVLMSIIGVASTNNTVTENLIVRNNAIRKQNLHMVDSVASEAYQRVSDVEFSDPTDPNAFMTVNEILPELPGHYWWVHDKDNWKSSGDLADWYNRNLIGRVLTPGNSEVPDAYKNDELEVLDQRGEYDADLNNSPIRYALVGWQFVSAGESIVVNQPGMPVVKKANLLIEYVSEQYGVIRLIIGIRKEFKS